VDNRTGAGHTTRPQHAVVESLARELNMPFEQVERVYTEQVRQIEATARIKTFVGVIVASRVRAELRQQQAVTEFDH